MGKLTMSMAIFRGYVKLPEGKNRDKIVPYKNNPKVVAINNEATLPMLTTPA